MVRVSATLPAVPYRSEDRHLIKEMLTEELVAMPLLRKEYTCIRSRAPSAQVGPRIRRACLIAVSRRSQLRRDACPPLEVVVACARIGVFSWFRTACLVGFPLLSSIWVIERTG